ncbi:flagellar biosynthesis protein FlhB [Vogesella sp. LIG4]|uniref:flagellar biosynthesis protein FlhB n=1 Tax=Vogesella sp. LIG4 TaxID=1192162 RepID=UPI00081FACE1|nr:flagellar biosynthesis protein FlhB [Vogesella sp. LIG4]SCK06166.1 flagellar biosynthetic protein FlhB [Vogesella sp. LIG4]
MAEESDQEDRTEAPSPRRLEQARAEGNVPRSRELTTFAITATGLALLMVTGGSIYQFLHKLMIEWFTFNQGKAVDGALILEHFRSSLLGTLQTLAPLLGALFLVALLAPMAIGGWNLSGKGFTPNFGKLNPASGLKRMFSLQAVAEGLKAILKSLLIGGVATWVIWGERGDLVGLVAMPLDRAQIHLVGLMEHTFIMVVGAMLLLVVFDVPYQLWQYQKNLRMTKDELKQEYKEQEGSPEVKGRIRQLQREAARKRMMQEVPKANVIVTNPTHYAVALLYDDKMAAPRLIAKGSLRLAERIIDKGKEHRVTVVRAPSFARALYFNVELNEDIPGKLYTAAAQVLAYVYQLQQYEQAGGVTPVFPEQLQVPPELDPESKRTQHTAPTGTH